MKKPLREGLREGDLANLCLPLISCDEYESMIDPSEAIVFGFYVHDELAAKDLSRFLQKSAVPILGTDVSPAPDQHGYYMVFIEMMDNERLGDNLAAIMHEISTLVDIEEDDWQLRIRGNDEILPFSSENLERGLAQSKKQTKKESVVEYFRHSFLNNAEFIDDLLILEGAGERYCLDFIDFNTTDDLLHDHKLTETGIRCDLRSVAKANRFNRMLGEGWDVTHMGSFILLSRVSEPASVLVKL